MAATICAFGNLVRDPIVRDVGERKVCSFTIGVKSNVKNEQGEYGSDFYDVSLWGRSVDYFVNKAQKGTGVFVSGTLTTGTYKDKDGNQRFSMRISCTEATPVSRLKTDTAAQPVQTAAQRTVAAPDDSLPF